MGHRANRAGCRAAGHEVGGSGRDLEVALDRGEHVRDEHVEATRATGFVAADVAQQCVERGASTFDQSAMQRTHFGMHERLGAERDPTRDGFGRRVVALGEVGVDPRVETPPRRGRGLRAGLDQRREALPQREQDLELRAEVVVHQPGAQSCSFGDSLNRRALVAGLGKDAQETIHDLGATFVSVGGAGHVVR